MTINCKDKLLNLDSPIVMGILNVTPDSFFDGGNYELESDILQQTKTMLHEGATIIDVGGYSSKPGAEEVSEQEELNRVIPAIETLLKNYPETIISIDTFRSKVAIKAVKAGASIINDISAGEMDSNMFNTVKQLQVPYCIMHMKGTPQNMQKEPKYDNVVTEVYQYLHKKVAELNRLGVNDIIIDLGFGFGKTIEHNYELLAHLSNFKSLNCPVLVGISRKSMIYKTLGVSAIEALNGTTALHSIALQSGGNILRVHDVKEAAEVIFLNNKLNENE